MKIKKKKSLKNKFIYLAASFLKEVGSELDVFIANPYDLTGYSRYRREAAANVAYQLKKIGDIEKVVDERGEAYYQFTNKGKSRLIKEVPLLRYQKKKWDGKWRQIIFDISEEQRVKREKLRRRLISLGFGMLQRSVYITPFDIKEEVEDFLSENSLNQDAIIFEMERVSGESEKELAETVWGLDDLHSRYLEFLEKGEELMRHNNEKFLEGFELVEETYFSILYDDPGLPKELMPKVWFSREANRLFRDLLKRFNQAKRKKRKMIKKKKKGK